ncbi:hypothetical protein GCM10010885_24670 [Alicyclobacillus cellulosilyticus]|uniref:histidine kinase n=1 Tax=Alicyclobacillus cellulosilyticus TaxID=1003997 RepID=A0A917KI20_9BACL|nr:ATP-binding protein [Alicyclobacillus cellulosilyticus]GGJ14480.1 hypothetical protein GCM10010885_24670 [Alicyclobacillus cellulosilyticus]
MAAESERLRTALLNSISHELRTPLTVILGAIETLEDANILLSEEDRTDLLRTIRQNAKRMHRLVSNLIGMARIESGMLALNRRWVDLADVIFQSIRDTAELTEGHPVRVELEEDLPLLEADEALLAEAIANLLTNAAKYSPPGSPIDIRARAAEGGVSICVIDRGMGIAPEEGEQLFEKFYRSPRAAHVPGTGLGLAIVKAVAEAHGGFVCASPHKPKGAEFQLWLPIRGERKP